MWCNPFLSLSLKKKNFKQILLKRKQRKILPLGIQNGRGMDNLLQVTT